MDWTKKKTYIFYTALEPECQGHLYLRILLSFTPRNIRKTTVGLLSVPENPVMGEPHSAIDVT